MKKYRTEMTVDGVPVKVRTVRTKRRGEFEIRKCVTEGWNVHAVVGGTPMFVAHYDTEEECLKKIRGEAV